MIKLRVVQDEAAESPRHDSNLGRIAYKHNRYTLGDEPIADPINWLVDKLGYSRKRVWQMADKINANYYSNAIYTLLSQDFLGEFVAMPVYLYDHSGQTIATTPFSCRWDSSQVGFIYATKEDMRENFGVKYITKKIRAKALKVLQAEIELFDLYVKGEVYGFEIVETEADGTFVDVLDSCWGFFGDDWLNNGILDYIDVEEYFPKLTKVEFEEMVKNLTIESK